MYYCFLCNQIHTGNQTKEHFIPQALNCPKEQWLPVCKDANARSNSMFDKFIKDILYMLRYEKSKALIRKGIAILPDGSQIYCKFSYSEQNLLNNKASFKYILDDTNKSIPKKNVFAIGFQVGLSPQEQYILYKELSKISIGSIVYSLKRDNVDESLIIKICSQPTINSLRHFIFDLSWDGDPIVHRFKLGRSEVLNRLHNSCTNTAICNHLIEINFNGNSIHIEGMLSSKCSWILDIDNSIKIDGIKARIENAIPNTISEDHLLDKTLSPDGIIIKNPDYIGVEPELPAEWRNY